MDCAIVRHQHAGPYRNVLLIPQMPGSRFLVNFNYWKYSLVEILTIPEDDSQTYWFAGKDLLSRVCSSFIMDIYKSAGVFGDLDLTVTEFTPRDTYQLAIFDYTKPSPCENFDADIPFCQVLFNNNLAFLNQSKLSGEYVLSLPGLNTIEPYSHMDEYCGALPTDYIRTPEGC